MKTDLYTKILLTIIAFCLTFNVLKDIHVIPNVYADNGQMVPVTSLPAASLLKTNEDGSLNVRLMSSSVMEVKPVYGATFEVKPSSSAEFKVKSGSGVIEVKPTSGARFSVVPASSAEFKVQPVSSSTKFTVENSQYDPLYVTPHRNAIFNVKQTGSSVYNQEIIGNTSTYVYPNPATEKITIVYSAYSPDEYLTICSVDGKIMDYIQLDPSRSELIVDISHYSSGTYVYNFNGNGGKFIVKK